MRRTDGTDGLIAFPFPAGESPFRVKGLAYRGHLEYVAESVPGGISAMLQGLEERTATFFEQSFLVSTFYDVVPLAVAGKVCGDLMGVPFLQFVQERTQHQAQVDIKGIHRALLKFVTVTAISKRMPWLVKQYFDFGHTEPTAVGPAHVHTAIHGIPEPIAPWFGTVCRTYVQAVLRARDVPSVRCEAGDPTPDGTTHGVPTVTEHFDTIWDT